MLPFQTVIAVVEVEEGQDKALPDLLPIMDEALRSLVDSVTASVDTRSTESSPQNNSRSLKTGSYHNLVQQCVRSLSIGSGFCHIIVALCTEKKKSVSFCKKELRHA